MEHKDNMLDLQKPEMCWVFTRGGALQRSYIYREKSDPEKRVDMRNRAKDYLKTSVFKKFRGQTITEPELYDLTEDFIDTIQKDYSAILRDGQLIYGNAQKFINLYLKGMWIMGELGPPPHFPVDRIIQQALKFRSIYSWTKMDREGYKAVIDHAQEKMVRETSFEHLAEYELQLYHDYYLNRR